MAEEQNEPIFSISKMYLKDASLEIPGAPEVFLESKQPSIDVQLNVESANVAEGIFETTVTVTVTSRIEDKVMFLVECKQGGIFEIRNIPEDQMDMLQNIVCPNIIYPYLRSNVADLIQRTGFPPLHLAEVNFEALYQQKEAEAAESEGPSLIVPPGAH